MKPVIVFSSYATSLFLNSLVGVYDLVVSSSIKNFVSLQLHLYNICISAKMPEKYGI